MINKIINAISVALDKEFGDECEIYPESVEQGLKEPCFSIALITPRTKQVLGNRYFRTHLFCIHYFPKKDKAECYAVQERLMDCLEYINLDGDDIRGTNINGEITDGVLHCYVNYNLYVNKELKREDPMEQLDQHTNMKG